MTENRRVSLPCTLAVPYYPSNQTPTRLSPPIPLSPGVRRSLPGTPVPGGNRRSLPGTPRTLSPRRTLLADVDELFPTSSSASSSSEASPGRSKRHRSPRYQYSLRDNCYMDPYNNNLVKEQKKNENTLRSFEVRHGHLIDNGYQDRPSQKPVLSQRDGRRATCPEIWLTPDGGKPDKHILMRIYGNKNSGKKSLAHMLVHHATSVLPERVSDSDNETSSKTIRFILNQEEVELEILLESALENSPFSSTLVMYIVIYNVDNRDSFHVASKLLSRICKSRQGTVALTQVLLIGNKIDLKRNQVVSTLEGNALAKLYRCPFVEMSALLSMNVDGVWQTIVKAILEPKKEVEEPQTLVQRIFSRGRQIARSCEEIVQKIIV